MNQRNYRSPLNVVPILDTSNRSQVISSLSELAFYLGENVSITGKSTEELVELHAELDKKLGESLVNIE